MTADIRRGTRVEQAASGMPAIAAAVAASAPGKRTLVEARAMSAGPTLPRSTADLPAQGSGDALHGAAPTVDERGFGRARSASTRSPTCSSTRTRTRRALTCMSCGSASWRSSSSTVTETSPRPLASPHTVIPEWVQNLD